MLYGSVRVFANMHRFSLFFSLSDIVLLMLWRPKRVGESSVIVWTPATFQFLVHSYLQRYLHIREDIGGSRSRRADSTINANPNHKPVEARFSSRSRLSDKLKGNDNKLCSLAWAR